MSFESYTALIATVHTWTHRVSMTAVIQDSILMTEAMFRYEPRPPQDPMIGGLRVLITDTETALVAGQSYIAKPSDYIQTIRFDLTGDTGGRVEYIAPDSMPLYFLEGTGRPRYYTVVENIEFNVAPDSAYAYEHQYYAQPAAISASNTSNVVLATWPEVYLSGVLSHTFEYMHDHENSARWMARYKVHAWAANQSFRGGLFTTGSLAAKTA